MADSFFVADKNLPSSVRPSFARSRARACRLAIDRSIDSSRACCMDVGRAANSRTSYVNTNSPAFPIAALPSTVHGRSELTTCMRIHTVGTYVRKRRSARQRKISLVSYEPTLAGSLGLRACVRGLRPSRGARRAVTDGRTHTDTISVRSVRQSHSVRGMTGRLLPRPVHPVRPPRPAPPARPGRARAPQHSTHTRLVRQSDSNRHFRSSLWDSLASSSRQTHAANASIYSAAVGIFPLFDWRCSFE